MWNTALYFNLRDMGRLNCKRRGEKKSFPDVKQVNLFIQIMEIRTSQAK